MIIEIKRSPKISLNFTKIIKTTNLTESISCKIIDDLKSEWGFRLRDDKYEGFNEEFIFNDEKVCELDFLSINDDYSSVKDSSIDYDENNDNHIKLFKLNYVVGSSGKYDHFIDFFFIPHYNLIIVNGSKSDDTIAYDKLNKKLQEIEKNKKNNFSFNEIHFSSDFLLWIIFKKTINENISDKIYVDRFLDFSTEDFPNEHGIFNPGRIPSAIATRNSTNMITLPIIYGLLNNRNFSHLGGKFKYLDNNFEIYINVYPTVEPKSDIFVKSVFCIKGESYCNKIKLTIPFIQNLVNSYLIWESYEPPEKYPSENFINDLKTNLISEFNMTFESYYNYKNDFNEKTGREIEDLGKIFSLNPKINLDLLDDESREYIDYLVEKDVLLYLSD